jgi:hypothetical protein
MIVVHKMLEAENRFFEAFFPLQLGIPKHLFLEGPGKEVHEFVVLILFETLQAVFERKQLQGVGVPHLADRRPILQRSAQVQGTLKTVPT